MASLRIVSLSSGSCGNCFFIEYNGHSFLLDAGLSLKATSEALKAIGASLADINAIVLTHEHRDHIAGVNEILEVHPVPLYLAAPVRSLIAQPWMDKTLTLPFSSNRPFRLGPWEILPVPIPHDATAPVGFFFKLPDFRFSYFVDIGRVTPRIIREMIGSDVIILESNHDLEMLTKGNYPDFLKRRIRSGKGHISNDEAAEALSAVFRARRAIPPSVFLAHLSENNNTPRKALETVQCHLLRDGNLLPAVDYLPRGTPKILVGG